MGDTAASGQADILIAGGEVIDGTGAPRRRAHIAVKDDRIVAIGDLAGWRAGRRVDAAGLVVAPGFIDAHTHDDRALLSSPEMAMKASQGVTTVVAGNCGVSLAPLVTDRPPPPLDLIGDGEWYRFNRFADYLDLLDREPPALNGVFLVGHSTLRVGTMDRLDRPADAAEIKAMRGRLEEGLGAGAIGLSTGLFYAPAKQAPTDEVVEIAAALKAHGGLYVTHMRDESDDVLKSLEETFEIGRRAGVGVVVSHHKVVGQKNFGRSVETLKLIDAMRQRQRIGFDVYPYHASSTVLKMDSIRLASRVLITWSKAKPEMAGLELADIARELGCSIEEAAEQLQPAGAIYFAMDEADVQRILRHPHAMIGSDGLPHDLKPHPRLWGTFPRVLGHYCRDLKLFPLEEAVRRMTGLPADQFGLADRGVLREGAFADVVLFNAETVADLADFESSTRPAAGIELVMVNGRPVWEDGRPTGARPGRALRHRAA